MTNCEITPLPMAIPAPVSTEGLELRVGPPILTPKLLERLQREAREEGKILFLDEMFNTDAFRQAA